MAELTNSGASHSAPRGDSGPKAPTKNLARQARAWLLLAVEGNREHAGNDGYFDQPDASYTWDSTVPNHAKISVGDRIAIWDKSQLLGASMVETIETDTALKTLYRCPGCERAGIKARTIKSPRFRCSSCHLSFDEPLTKSHSVTTYRTRHDAAWVPLEGTLSAQDLRSLCEAPRSQLSIRPLRWAEFVASIEASSTRSKLDLIDNRVKSLDGGHTQALVRVRVGQRNFREHLFERFGNVCALSGPAPDSVLEAGHLYSYARVGEHDTEGGFLLRRDLHRLFDLGLVLVDPQTLTIDVGPSLSSYPLYAALHGQKVKVGLTSAQRAWLHRHWEEHVGNAQR